MKSAVVMMCRSVFQIFVFVLGLLPAALILSSSADAREQLDVCYYDSNGNQHDADWCYLGWDLSHKDAVNLSPHCRNTAGAVCHLGLSGDCRTGSSKYAKYVIFPSKSGRCPTTFSQAVSQRSGGGGGGVVAPSCPPNYVFSGGQCIRSAGPAPSCPPNFIFSQGQCIRSGKPSPPTYTPPPYTPPPVAALYPREVQANLYGLGCLTGSVDGVWGPGSRAALRRFSNLSNSGLPYNSSQPTQQAFDATSVSSAPSCPPVYVAPQPPTYQPTPPPTVTKKVRCSKVKYGFTRGNTCACSDNRVFNGYACVKPVDTPWQPGECRVIGGEKVCS